jgi:hypothetical protein
MSACLCMLCVSADSHTDCVAGVVQWGKKVNCSRQGLFKAIQSSPDHAIEKWQAPQESIPISGEVKGASPAPRASRSNQRYFSGWFVRVGSVMPLGRIWPRKQK